MSTYKDYLICWEIHVPQWQSTPRGIMTTILLLAVNCKRVNMLAKGRYCSHNAPREPSSSSFQDGCGQPPAEADKEPGLRAQEPSLPSPLQVWLSQHCHLQARPASLPWLPGCCALGIKAAFVPRRQMAVPGASAHLAVGHGRHQPRSLLMRNAQDIHGRDHRSKWLALNYIFSD